MSDVGSSDFKRWLEAYNSNKRPDLTRLPNPDDIVKLVVLVPRGPRDAEERLKADCCWKTYTTHWDDWIAVNREHCIVAGLGYRSRHREEDLVDANGDAFQCSGTLAHSFREGHAIVMQHDMYLKHPSLQDLFVATDVFGLIKSHMETLDLLLSGMGVCGHSVQHLLEKSKAMGLIVDGPLIRLKSGGIILDLTTSPVARLIDGVWYAMPWFDIVTLGCGPLLTCNTPRAQRVCLAPLKYAFKRGWFYLHPQTGSPFDNTLSPTLAVSLVGALFGGNSGNHSFCRWDESIRELLSGQDVAGSRKHMAMRSFTWHTGLISRPAYLDANASNIDRIWTANYLHRRQHHSAICSELTAKLQETVACRKASAEAEISEKKLCQRDAAPVTPKVEVQLQRLLSLFYDSTPPQEKEQQAQSWKRLMEAIGVGALQQGHPQHQQPQPEHLSIAPDNKSDSKKRKPAAAVVGALEQQQQQQQSPVPLTVAANSSPDGANRKRHKGAAGVISDAEQQHQQPAVRSFGDESSYAVTLMAALQGVGASAAGLLCLQPIDTAASNAGGYNSWQQQQQQPGPQWQPTPGLAPVLLQQAVNTAAMQQQFAAPQGLTAPATVRPSTSSSNATASVAGLLCLQPIDTAASNAGGYNSWQQQQQQPGPQWQPTPGLAPLAPTGASGMDVNSCMRNADPNSLQRYTDTERDEQFRRQAEQRQRLRKALLTSEYRGVSWAKGVGKWVAHCSQHGKKRHLGYFVSEVEAAREVDKQMLQFVEAGFPTPFKFNFPQEHTHSL